MLKAKDIQPGTYITRNRQSIKVGRVWMGIIYSLEKESRRNAKHIWFGTGQYDISGYPHPMDLIERVG